MNILDVFLKSNILSQVIVVVLVTISMFSWGVIIYQIFLLNIIKQEIKDFENKFWSGKSLSELYRESVNQRFITRGIERIFCSGFKVFSQIDHMNNYSIKTILKEITLAMNIAAYMELQELETYMVFLNIIGSISPYFGLFGTILSIIYVFFKLGTMKYITLQIIAPGVAEALIFTALGLLIAIPATIAFHYLNRSINNIEIKYRIFLEEVSSVLQKKLLSNKKNR